MLITGHCFSSLTGSLCGCFLGSVGLKTAFQESAATGWTSDCLEHCIKESGVAGSGPQHCRGFVVVEGVAGVAGC